MVKKKKKNSCYYLEQPFHLSITCAHSSFLHFLRNKCISNRKSQVSLIKQQFDKRHFWNGITMLYVTQLQKVRISLDIQPLESFCSYLVKKIIEANIHEEKKKIIILTLFSLNFFFIVSKCFKIKFSKCC